jgi:hypothetical protein
MPSGIAFILNETMIYSIKAAFCVKLDSPKKNPFGKSFQNPVSQEFLLLPDESPPLFLIPFPESFGFYWQCPKP